MITRPIQTGQQITFTPGPDNRVATVNQIVSATSDNPTTFTVEILPDQQSAVITAVAAGTATLSITLDVTEPDGTTRHDVMGQASIIVSEPPPPPQPPVIPPAASVVFTWGLPVTP